MYVENLTGSNEIGSHCFHVMMGNTHIVLDSGVHPKREGLASLPEFDRLPAGEAEALFVTHAHLDHMGAVPVLNEKQPGITTYMTPGTLAIGEAMLHNSVNVMSSKRIEEGIVDYPFFTHQDLDRMIDAWRTYDLGKTFTVGNARKVKATFHSAGHILGAAGVVLEADGHRLLYTGDVNFEDQATIPGATLPTKNIDTLLLECTRGAVPRREGYTRKAEEKRFAESIQASLDKGGIVLVPVFALGKTQEVLLMIHQFKKKGWVSPNAPVYIGGLSTKVTRIFDNFADNSPRMLPGFRIMDEVDVTVAGKKSSKGLFRCHPGGIYVLSSGMMTEKTLSNRIAEQILPHPANSLLMVGYADPDSPAGAIKRAKPGEKIKMHSHCSGVPLNCKLETFDFSGHADREQLLEFARQVSPERLFLVHGDQDALDWMKDACEKILPNTEIFIAEPNMRYEWDV